MKIDKLHIKSPFKQLENIEIDFDEDNLMTVLVGRNGSGKSNIIEALVSIFRNLDLGESPPFAYQLVYRLGSSKEVDPTSHRWFEIKIDADISQLTKAKQYSIHYKDLFTQIENKLSITKVQRDKNGESEFLPKHLFAYYSGTSNRLEKYFTKHRTDFYVKLLKDKIDLKGNIRPLFYAKPYHSQFVLLAFFLSDKESIERQFILDHLGIESLDSVHFILRKPNWAKSQNINELFWGATGVVRKFLDELIQHTLAPIKLTRTESVSETGSSITNEFFHLFLPSVDALREFAKGLTPDELFKMLESTLLSDIISEVSIRVNIKTSVNPVTFNELSEGEQQLLTVLGLLRFTGGDDSLFLLDEPETHLNPGWSVQYLQFLNKFVPNAHTSQFIMITHHPLTIAELEKKQVQVIHRDENYKVHAFEPDESPRGMGINLILRSEMFGLKTTLDEHTNKKLILRNQIAAKDNLSTQKQIFDEEVGLETEGECLSRLNNELEELGFNLSSDDPDYMDFLQQKYHKE